MSDEMVAPHGEKMIEVNLRFWTNNIAKGGNKIKKKHCWDRGIVRFTKNNSHGIDPLKSIKFNSIAEIPSVIEKVFISHKIKVHRSPKSKKYLD